MRHNFRRFLVNMIFKIQHLSQNRTASASQSWAKAKLQSGMNTFSLHPQKSYAPPMHFLTVLFEISVKKGIGVSYNNYIVTITKYQYM